MNVLVVTDMQNDFIDGALGTKEAIAIVPRVIETIKNFDGAVFYTIDTHYENYLQSQEGRNLPVVHCVKNTPGWRLHPNIAELSSEDQRFEKNSFGSIQLAEALLELNTKEKIDSVTCIGLCTDICVISNVVLIKSVLPEAELIVDAACCAGVTPQSHQRALDAMKVFQVKIINE